MQAMLDVGIATRKGIMTAHREPAFAYMNEVQLPISEDLADNSVLLPLYAQMSNDDFNYVMSNIDLILTT